MTKKTTKKSKTKKPAAASIATPAAAAPRLDSRPAPTPETIGARAHQIWIAKGKPVPGTPVEDWLQAERELGTRKA